jgi:TolA-binding protein
MKRAIQSPFLKFCRWLAAIALIGLPIAGTGAVPPAEADDPQIKAAAQAREEGVPEVAVARLRELLAKAHDEREWRATATELVQALLGARQPAQALALLDDARLTDCAACNFWRAQALAGMERWNDALPLYQAAANDSASPNRAAAIFGAAEMLRALARPDETLSMLARLTSDERWTVRARLLSAEILLDKSDWTNAQRLLDEMNPTSSEERKQRRFLRARLDLVRQRPERALGTFESLVKKPEGASHALLIAALFGVADAHLQLKTPEGGDDFLEDFIDRHPQDENLAQLFAKLDELYRAERKPARVELEKWTREAEQPRRAFAQWYLALIELRAGHRDRALALLDDMRKSNKKNPAVAAGLFEFARLEEEEGHFGEAIAILREARALQPEASLLNRINHLEGESHYGAQQFEAATANFEQAARAGSDLGATSLFNASLGWLQLGNDVRFLADYKELERQGSDQETRSELRLNEGLVQAEKGAKNASESLQKFLHDFPDSKRASEAWVALAELAFHATPPRLDEARKDLQRARESKPTAAATERADYLAIWIEDAEPGNDSKLIEQAARFLERHGASLFAGDVKMKLAEAYYRRQDFANAQTQFESLAQQNPSGPTAEKALYFAAESAMSTMGPHSLDRAIELFEKVVQLKGELRWAARNEQAVIERRLGRPPEALLLYEEVLKSDAKPNEKREALCGKGDIYFDMGPEDAKNYDRAIEAYDQLAAEGGEPGHWRNQALFKKGVSLEKKDDRASALTTFYKVIEGQTRPDRSPEFFWFYKAGFNAARLLEDGAKWDSAAAVYEKLVAAGGARSEEAQARLNRLRLEHFLWDN